MSQFVARLNLRPQERRILVVVTTIVLVVLNAIFVWPHFKDWRRVETELAKTRQILKSYRDEVARIPDYTARLDRLEGQGSAVLPADQALQLQRAVQNQATASGVAITSTRTVPNVASSTNAYFDEQTVVIGVNTGDKELVDFLVALGSGNSMIRAKDLDLRPDPSQLKLNGNITLVASYQKKPKPPAPPPGAPAKPSSTAVTPTKKKP